MVTTVRGTKSETVESNGRSIGVETITPIEATAYLESMPGNRPLSNRLVEYLVQQANAGTFYPMVAPIHFDTQGRLRNGQHRMWMVIDSEKTQQFLVVRNASEEEIDALDIGKRRTGGDVLALDGYANGGMLSGALQNLWMYEHNIVPGHARSFFSTKNAPGMTNHMVREFVTLHPKLLESVEYLKGTPSIRLIGPPAMLAFCHYAILRANPIQGPDFWASVATQVFWGQNDPAFRLYDRLSRSKAVNERKDKKLIPTEVAALTIKAWNMWVQGKDVTILRWSIRGGTGHQVKAPGFHPTGEDFPRIRSK
jgi:hypothetical protein